MNLLIISALVSLYGITLNVGVADGVIFLETHFTSNSILYSITDTEDNCEKLFLKGAVLVIQFVNWKLVINTHPDEDPVPKHSS